MRQGRWHWNTKLSKRVGNAILDNEPDDLSLYPFPIIDIANKATILHSSSESNNKAGAVNEMVYSKASPTMVILAQSREEADQGISITCSVTPRIKNGFKHAEGRN